MILHTPVRRFRLFIGYMLLCIMCITHTASAGECVTCLSPTEHEAVEVIGEVAGETITGNAVVYNFTLVETKDVGSARNIIRPVLRRASPIAMSSHNSVRSLLKTLENRGRLSVIATPPVTLFLHQKGKFITDTEVPSYEIMLIPIRYENDGVFTKIVVKRTDIHDGEEKTYQWETSSNMPTNDQSSWLANGKLGGKEFALLVTAERTLHTTVLPTLPVELMIDMEQWKEAQRRWQEEMTQ